MNLLKVFGALFLSLVNTSTAISDPLQTTNRIVLQTRVSPHFVECDQTVLSPQPPGNVLGSITPGPEVGSIIVRLHQNGKSTDFSTSTILGYYATDFGPRTYIAMRAGTSEDFIIFGLSSGKHIISTGAVYVLPDGSTVSAGSFDTCYLVKPGTGKQ